MAVNGHNRAGGRLRGYPSPVAARRPLGRTPQSTTQRPAAGLPVGVDSSRVKEKLRKKEPRSLADLVEAMRGDYQGHFSEAVLRSNVQAVAVTVSTESRDERDVAYCEKMQDVWERHVVDMCDAIGHGRVAFEQRWAFCEKSGVNYLRRLDALPFRNTKMLVEDGRFCGIKLSGPESITEDNSVTIPPDCAWWLALDATVVEPHGKSRFLGAPRVEWESRSQLFSLRLKYLRKFMLRGGVIRGPGQVKDPRTGEWIDTASAIAASLDDLREGGFLFLSDTRDKNGNFLFDVEEPPKLEDPTPIEVALDKSDIRMLRSFAISELSVQQTGDLGSFAMAVMHRLILNATVGGIVSQFSESFAEHCVHRGALLNHMPGSLPEISVTFPDMTAVPDSLMVEIAKAVVTSPALPPGAALLNLRTIFEVAGIPITDDFDARIQKALATAAATVPTATIPAGSGGSVGSLRSPVGLANALPGGEQKPAVEVHGIDRLLSDAQSRMAAAYGRLFDLAMALRNATPFSRGRIEGEIADVSRLLMKLYADTKLASRLLGMLSPWKPDVGNWDAVATQKPIAMALLDSQYEWPWMQSAVEFLVGKSVVTQSQFDALSRDDQLGSFSVPGSDDIRFVSEVRDEVVRSLESGESLESFRDRMESRLGIAESDANSLFRTNTHQAYVEGQEKALSSPAVAEAFPYVMYAATADTRTRPAHAAADGFVVRRGTKEHAVLLKLLKDWNCRCTLIPLGEDDARQRGIKTYADLPDVILDAVGLVSSLTFSNTNPATQAAV